jgi:hypothetical protein
MSELPRRQEYIPKLSDPEAYHILRLGRYSIQLVELPLEVNAEELQAAKNLGVTPHYVRSEFGYGREVIE